MKINDNDHILKLEIPKNGKEESQRIHKKIINKTTYTYKKVLTDKLSGFLGEC